MNCDMSGHKTANAVTLQAARQRVVDEALRWVGTPYHHQADLRGIGVDCAMLLVRVYATTGCIPPSLDPRPYAPEWHLHRGDELYLGWLDVHGIAQPQGSDIAPADVVVWRFGRTYSHAAIVIGQGHQAQIVHALRPSGAVVLGRLTDTGLTDRPRIHYRLKALGAAVVEKAEA